MAENIKDIQSAVIFVLDDEENITTLIKQALADRADTTIKTFTDLDAMIADPDLASVDLFIVDINLKSDRSGFEVPALLPQQCRFAAWLFMSGYELNAELYRRASQLSLFDFIGKPFALTVLKQKVKLLLAARLRLPDTIDDRLINIWSRDHFLAVVLDDQTSIRLANAKAANMLQVDKPRDLVGRTWIEYIPGHAIDAFIKNHAKMIDGDDDALTEYEGEIISAFGVLKNILWFNSAFEADQAKRLILSIGIPLDARARKIKEMKQIYREILIKDRSAIRAIKPLKAPIVSTCFFQGGKQ